MLEACLLEKQVSALFPKGDKKSDGASAVGS